MIFGKPQWFCPAHNGLGLRPACWQGWLCALAWIAIIVVPFGALIGTGRGAESLIWLVVACGCLLWDARQIRKHLRCGSGCDEVLYIGDEPENDHLATRNYDFRLRQ